jgi:nitrogen fixation/metabolism regulation signal transduction histidine kinase
MMGKGDINEMVNSEEFQDDIKEAKEDMKKMVKMSFDEWKKFARQRDPEMKQMSDKELKAIYDDIQKMAKYFNQ